MAASPSRAQAPAGEGEVRTVVTEFGKHLRDVSLMAPKAAAAKQIDGAYAPYIAAKLLAEGVARIIVCADEPDRFRALTPLPAGVDLWHRDRLNDA